MTTILIVEDEAIVAADLAGKLGRLGYEVAGIAARGEEAVALAFRLRPHLVLMDIQLEGSMDGIEAAKAISRQHDVPVIYLTAHSDSATLARAKLTGPFGFILKPFEERDLATQIELALYKHKADRQLREQREWLLVTLTSIGDAVIATDAAGLVTFINPVAESLTGWKAEEAAGLPVPQVCRILDEQTGKALDEPVARVLREGQAVPLSNHAALVTRDGRTVPVEDSATPILDATGQVIGVVLVFHDVTEKRRAEQERENTVEFLHLVNRSRGTADMLRVAATFFQRKSGCEAVGIRLKDGDDYPYKEARGFPQEFVEMGNSLCARDAAGNIIRESDGNPYVACMCGNVICGRVDPSRPFFSPGGSFWTNSTTKLPAATSDADRQTRTRNRCNGEGYESVALIPLHVGAERLGLLQLNDRRTGMFSPEIIALWERLSGYLAVAVAKSIADEKIRHQNAILEAINRIFREALTCETEEELGLTCLAAAEDLTQSRFGFIGEVGSDGLLHDIAISGPGWELCAMYDRSGHRRLPGDFKLHGLYGRVLMDGKSLLTNNPSLHPDSIGTPEGHPPVKSFLGVPLIHNGKTIGMIAQANREGGYEQKNLEALEAIAPAMVQAMLRKQTEEALRRSEARRQVAKAVDIEWRRFKDVLEILPAYVLLLSPDYHVPFANRFFRERFGESHGRRCYEYLFGRTEPCESCETYRVLKTDAPHHWEWIGPDGRNYDIYDFPFTDADGSPLIMEMGIDITKRKQVEQALRELNETLERRTAELETYMKKLQESNQALQDFASIASHDMQEPLRKVTSFGNRLKLKHGSSLGDEGRDYLDRMVNAAGRMQSLLKSLLDYSRVTTKAEPFIQADLAAIVRDVLSDLEVRIEKTGGEVNVRDLPTVEADPTQMHQLFQNLIGNALKFHKDGEKPFIEVRGTSPGNAITEIVVADNGIGFDEKYLDRIFAPFQRLHGRGEYEGTGMGLAICKKIVERHGGSITARSEPGKGSIFILSLPLNRVSP